MRSKHSFLLTLVKKCNKILHFGDTVCYLSQPGQSVSRLGSLNCSHMSIIHLFLFLLTPCPLSPLYLHPHSLPCPSLFYTSSSSKPSASSPNHSPTFNIHRASPCAEMSLPYSNWGRHRQPFAGKELAIPHISSDLGWSRVLLSAAACNVTIKLDAGPPSIGKRRRLSNERASDEVKYSKITPSLFRRRKSHFTGKMGLMITLTPKLCQTNYLKSKTLKAKSMHERQSKQSRGGSWANLCVPRIYSVSYIRPFPDSAHSFPNSNVRPLSMPFYDTNGWFVVFHPIHSCRNPSLSALKRGSTGLCSCESGYF